MRIIIVGCGKVGSELAGQRSAAGHDLTTVSTCPNAVWRNCPTHTTLLQ